MGFHYGAYIDVSSPDSIACFSSSITQRFISIGIKISHNKGGDVAMISRTKLLSIKSLILSQAQATKISLAQVKCAIGIYVRFCVLSKA